MSPEEAAYSYYTFMEPEHGEKVTLENSTTVALDIRDLNLHLEDVCFLTYRFYEKEVPKGYKPLIDLKLNFYDLNGEVMEINNLGTYFFYLYNPGNILVNYL
jgi:hypothetical protein